MIGDGEDDKAIDRAIAGYLERKALEEIKARVELAQSQMDRSFDTLEKAILQMSDARAQMATISGVLKEGALA